MVELKNRRIKASVYRTVKFGKDFEFIKFDLGEEGDVPDGVDAEEARQELFSQLMKESAMKESIIKATNNNTEAIDKIAEILKGLLKSSRAEEIENKQKLASNNEALSMEEII